MSSAFDELFALGRAVLQQQHGRAVTYLPPVADAVGIAVTAIVGPPAAGGEQRVADNDGFHTATELRDFVVAAAELAVEGVAIEPTPGGRFVQPATAGDVSPGDGYVYEVANRAGLGCWEWADERDHTHRRVRTHFIGRVSDVGM